MPREMPKAMGGHGHFRPLNGADGIVTASSHDHPRLRKATSPVFSDRALKNQEDLLISYIEELIRALHEKSSQPVNLVEWLNWTTFDIIGGTLI